MAVLICIPDWYHSGMTTQIAVRLDDSLVEFVDALVRGGRASSRAAAVSSALERERRRLIAEHDAQILAAAGDDGLGPLVEHVANLGIDLD